jgi:hypothetical protein
MARKSGPKPGQFNFMVERTWRLVASLADTQYCNAGDAFIAKKLDCSTRSVRRYLKKLKDTGRLTRTTVSYMVPGGWRKKRLMKTRFETNEFGLTRYEVLNWQRTPEKGQPVKHRVVAMAKPKVKPVDGPERFYNKRHPYFEVKFCDIEGFGDPWHEDMDLRNVVPSQANIPSKTVCAEMMARIRSWQSAPRIVDPEYEELSRMYVLGNVARWREEEKLKGNIV